MDLSTLERYLADSPARAASLTAYDYGSGRTIAIEGGRVYHAASTIKIAILAALVAAVEAGRFRLEDRLHVRNRFVSVADARPYRISPSRDANAEVQAARGKVMRIRELARHMIVTSSNLATNLLIDLVGVDYARERLEQAEVRGVWLRRGVEDDAAFEAGINNEVTSDGLASLLRRMYEGAFASTGPTEEMLDILAAQEFNSGIPAGLPSRVREEGRVAHKTGEISTVAHDAGIVFSPEREPVVVVVCTEWDPDEGGRMEVIAGATQRLWHVLNPEEDA